NNPHCSDTAGRTSALNPATPWCSPAGLTENRGALFQPGDTIYIKSGDYKTGPCSVTTAGTPDHPIVLRPYPGDRVTIRGARGACDALISLKRAAYWTIDSLTMISSTQGRVIEATDANGLMVRNCQLTLGPQRDTVVVHLVNSSNAVIENNTFIGIADALRRHTPTTSDGLLLDNSHHCTIRNCRFADCGHIALNLRNSGTNVVEKNTIENRLHTAMAIGNIPGNPGSASGNIIRANTIRKFNLVPITPKLPGIGIEILYASNNLICNNLIYEGGNNSTGIFIGADPGKGRATGNKIYNNTICWPGGRGIDLANFGAIGTKNGIADNKVFNNIISGITTPAAVDNELSRSAPIAMTFPGFEENLGYGNEIKNNLLSGADSTLVKSRDANCRLKRSYSLESLSAAGFTRGNITGDPRFVAPGKDFHLGPSSPARRAGIPLREVDTDFDGRARAPRENDIGAFQSSSP
ncbi:MAG TPA: right-handed parallel beta-helix repeat-containing protein, partial [Phycisphaerae bacterium]|nr:right-handed parallel beta-helix repeat-containing protein [Phycisphaerae bacterium]